MFISPFFTCLSFFLHLSRVSLLFPLPLSLFHTRASLFLSLQGTRACCVIRGLTLVAPPPATTMVVASQMGVALGLAAVVHLASLAPPAPSSSTSVPSIPVPMGFAAVWAPATDVSVCQVSTGYYCNCTQTSCSTMHSTEWQSFQNVQICFLRNVLLTFFWAKRGRYVIFTIKMVISKWCFSSEHQLSHHSYFVFCWEFLQFNLL